MGVGLKDEDDEHVLFYNIKNMCKYNLESTIENIFDQIKIMITIFDDKTNENLHHHQSSNLNNFKNV